MSYHNSETKAVCRGCGLALIGKPFHLGGSAYHPRTKEEVKVNFYGGFVCGELCDRNASREQEGSMPGAGESGFLSTFAQRSIARNWGSR